MKRLSLYIITFIFLIGIASAVYDVGGFQRNTIIDIKLPCSFNGTFCNTGAACNVTLNYPNGSHILNAQNMSNFGNGMPNATLPNSNVTGEYEGFYICCQNGFCDSSALELEISETGTELSTGQGVVYLIFVLVLIFIFLLCGWGAIKIPWRHPRDSEGRIISVNELKYVKIVLYVFSYLILMFIAGIMRSITSKFLFLSGASKMFDWMWTLLFAFMFPIIIVSLILTLIYFIDNKKLHKAILRGVPLR